ncbi:alpha/beta fold hydrolase [Williamsia sterculiae]|uniref:Acyl-CoA synthetase (AMP-forming)/AMP-acid ligase II n=1 Tax=Williamsia sterculiae TaxID=1344003 RepID=A0A1N7ECL9_9NOCA|nr:alpha/beta fold hydrolase [Williamsia sterculiae]SIR85827.1 Acyl-CoA synthetase (AMP-forming)/AMP-acid ligase II [Williamsia sterculiae]
MTGGTLLWAGREALAVDRSTGSFVPRPNTVGWLLSQAARQRPDALAVVTSTGSVTYRQLVDGAVDVARHLGDRHSLAPVPVHQDGGTAAITTALGALIAGRPLVLVDPGLPDQRVDTMLRLAEAESMTRTAYAGAVRDVRADDLALIGFTSGSTGAPKGVLLSQSACVAKATDVVSGQGLCADDVLANLLPLGFGAGITTLLAGLACGATVLCIDPRDTAAATLLSTLRRRRATTVQASAALVRALGNAASGGASPVPTLRQITLYGEAPFGADMMRAREALAPAATLVNWYATTEAGVVAMATFPPGVPITDGRLPAGGPVAGRRLRICDEGGRRVPDGTVGEVVVCGSGFADGYLHLASDRFAPDGTWYRTGDRGFRDARGVLHLVGRVDDAVKIRGYLVEPGDVAAALRGIAVVSEAAVVARYEQGRTELVGYVAGPTVPKTLGDDEIRTALRAQLPEWMVPRHLVLMTELPRNERGKVDRSALPAPRAQTPARRRAHRGDLVDVAVALAVAEALRRDDITDDQDLVALGADSLALTTIISTLRARLHVDIDLATFGATPTVTTLTATVRDALDNSVRTRSMHPVLVPLRTSGTGTPLFYVVGAGAPAVSAMALVRHLPADRPVYALQAHGLESRGRPDRTIRDMADRYLDLLGEVQPDGGYLLAGHSMGGVVALEMAAQLADRGRTAKLVVAVDAMLSERMVDSLPVTTGADHVTDDERVPDAESERFVPDITLSAWSLATIVVKQLVAGRVQFEPLTQWMIFYNRGLRMLRRHRIRRLSDVPVVLVRSRGNRQPAMWWRAITTGPVTETVVDGEHNDLVRDPHVAQVAAVITGAVSDVD